MTSTALQFCSVLALAATLALATACGGGDGKGNGKPGDGKNPSTNGGGTGGGTGGDTIDFADIPEQGEGLKDIDWNAFFPPGDGWKQYEQEFRYNNNAEPETLDPHLMTGVTEHTLALGLFEGLTITHPRTLQALPGVAEWWELSEDGREYVFHLRADAKFTNGEPVTADDFVYSWNRALDPKTGSHYAEQFFAIVNAREFNASEITDFTQVGVKSDGPHKLLVTLNDPTPYFLELTAFETLMPVHRKTIEKHGDQWTKPANFVGNGPFKMVSWKARDAIVMEPNEHYWNRGIVRLKRIRASSIDELNTAYQQYKSGAFDFLRDIPNARIEEILREPDYYAWPYLGVYFFRYNVERKPFDDPRVRHALNLAINKAEICERTLQGGQTPATAVVPPTVTKYRGAKGEDYNPEKARALLAEAGYPGGKGFPEFELHYNTSENHKKTCEVLRDMWSANLGITAKLRNSEWQIYLKDQRAQNYDVSRAGWIGDYMDPHTFLDMWVTGRGNNNTGWSNAEYDALIISATQESNNKKRNDLYRQAEELLLKDMPILPVYYYVSQGMLRPRVKGLMENVRHLHPFQFMYIDGPEPTGK